MNRLIGALTALLPLVCWPGLEQPFSTPKLWLIGLLAVLVAAARRDWRIPGWPWLAWLAAVALSAVIAPYVSLRALLLLLLPAALYAADLPPGKPIMIGSAVESGIVLLQYFGYDPFLLFGWRPESFGSPRMRVYGTLGNPDFVAAWLCGALPLATNVPVAILLLAAIVATGSRVALLALPAAAVVLALRKNHRAKWWLLGLPLAGALVLFSAARPLGATIQGRLYLARVTLAHLWEVPPAGYGPGSFVLKFSEWQIPWLRDHPADAPFAGPVDHAHNDYLEFWVEYGPLGACAFLVLCGWLLARAWRRGAPDGALAGLAALLAIATVDFPLHRPAEWALFWMLLGRR